MNDDVPNAEKDNGAVAPEPTLPVSAGAAPLPVPGKVLSAAARRALDEAAARKRDQDAKTAELTRATEIDGRGGLEPVRYNDWEVKGLATDF